MHLNTVGLGNPVKRTCSTCHGMHMTGMDTANGWMDIGTTNLPWAKEPPVSPWSNEQAGLPLFKVTCNNAVAPHPFLGRVIYTQDPGRALISGKCNDVGTIVMQQFRGLAARAPYFLNGSASNLRELVDFYDRRFNIQYTEQEKQDLVELPGHAMRRRATYGLDRVPRALKKKKKKKKKKKAPRPARPSRPRITATS